MKVAQLLLCVCLALLPLSLAGYVVIFTPQSYAPLFDKYHVQQNFPWVEITGYNAQVLAYLQGNDYYPLDIALTGREISHMEDVRSVTIGFTWFVRVLVLLTLILLFLQRKKSIAKLLFRAGIASLALCVAILLSVLFAFEAFFTFFHSLFFQPGTWLFLSTDMLITLYPEGLFQDLGIAIFTLALLLSGAFIIAGKAYIQKGTKQRHEN